MKLTMRVKLLGAFSLLIFLMLVTSTFTLMRMNSMESSVQRIDREWLPSAVDVGAIKSTAWNVDDLVGKYAMETNKVTLVKLRTELNSALSEEKLRQLGYKALISSNSQNHAAELGSYQSFARDWDTYSAQIPAILQASDGGNPTLARHLFKATEVEFDKVRSELNSLVTLNEQGAKSSSHTVVQLVDQSRTMNIILGVIALILGLSVAWFLSSRMSAAIRKVRDVSVKIAEGDLRVDELRPRSQDEIADLEHATNQMVKHLKQLIGGVMTTSEMVAAASEELSASADETTRATNQVAVSAQDVATGAENQVRSAEESALAMEELASGIQRIAETSSVVTQASMDTSQVAEIGNDAIQRAAQQMQSVQSSVQDSSAQLKNLSERSQQVSQMVEVITGIASQTNLLALNAAIEAARAGESGRGFAVVAEEVRKLAEQSAGSARQIVSIVQDMQESTDQSMMAMNRVTTETESGLVLVSEAGASFQNILQATYNVANQIMEVSAASEQMSAATQEITASIEEMANVSRNSASHVQSVAAATEEQLASMEEITASSASLSQMAQELQDLIRTFKM